MDFALRRDRPRGRPSFTGRADLHVHSLYSDGGQAPEAIVRAAAGRLDVVAITDHDDVAGALRARDFAREHPEPGVDEVVGEEISTLNGHLLGLYLSERVPPGLSAYDTIQLVHAQGGLAVAAHPFHPLRGTGRGHRSIGRLIPDLPLDAIEVVNNAGVFSRLYDAHDVSDRSGMPGRRQQIPRTIGSTATPA
jgi:predicted metal-dependent phosphoesterase TrpH